jgi:hypothetical protein
MKFPKLIEKLISQKDQDRGIRSKPTDEELFEAIRKGDLNEISNLIKAGANIHASYQESEYDDPISALSLACLHRHIDIVKLLLKKGAKGQGDPLTFAAKGGSVEILKLLVRNGHNIHPMFSRPRWAAAEAGNLEALKFLVAQGDRINDDYLLELAGGSKNRELFDYILVKGNFLAKDPNAVLAGFVALNDTKGIEGMIKAGADVNFIKDVESHEYPEEPLRVAASHNNIESIKTLLKNYPEEKLEALKEWDHRSTLGGEIVEGLVSKEFARRKREIFLEKVKTKIKKEMTDEQMPI